ncbi:MAG: hypothetical protein GF344_15465 [Chitinivibrionales bacterium]|nr:hypothetical protein [Chitinivibrionales bacterium]MBD3358103.1 hypothetical protein [Chitinivibrionales bacterium]
MVRNRTLRAMIPVALVTHLALGGVLWVMAASWYLGCRPDPAVSLIFAGLVFGIYMINRFTDRREDLANNSDRLWLMERGHVFFYLGVLGLAGSTGLLVVNEAMTGFHLALILLGLAYSYRFFPWLERGEIRFVRLKEIPFVKNLTVGLLWGSSVFVIPILFHGLEATLSLGMVLLVVASTTTVLTNTIFCDVRDVTGDRLAGNRTLPCLIGVSATYKMLAALNIVVIATASIAYAFNAAEVGQLTYVFLVSFYPLIYIVAHERKWLSRAWVEFVADSTPMICAAGLVLLRLTTV